jgi:predicted nucleic acid-binding protein
MGDTEAMLSIITVIELAHGIERANTSARQIARERFLNELLNEISVEPITIPIAFRAGKLDGARRSADRHDGFGTRLRRSDTQRPTLPDDSESGREATLKKPGAHLSALVALLLHEPPADSHSSRQCRNFR